MGMQRRQFLTGLGVAAVAGTLGAWGATRMGGALAPSATAGAPAAARYVCPMHPHIAQDHPGGSCPICDMDLVPLAQADPAAIDRDMVHVAPAAQRHIGVQLATATVGDMARTISAFAIITPDESTAIAVNPKVEGWLRSVPIQGVGQPVRRGQVLYEIYSPELQQRQREYVDLLTRKDGILGGSMDSVGSNRAMAGSLAKEKFRLRARLIAADMSEALVDQLEKSRRIHDVVAVRASRDGLVTALNMREGSYVNPMQQILAYADYSTVWAEISLFPDQLEWIRDGDRLLLRSALDKRATQAARVDLATLQIDPATRNARLRLALTNLRGAFRPGAFADVEIAASSQRSLQVPRDALIRTGHGDFVIVAEPGDHFRRAKVAAGIENGDAVAILSGLKEGDRVAANGQFLLDGAASMQALQQRLASGGAP